MRGGGGEGEGEERREEPLLELNTTNQHVNTCKFLQYLQLAHTAWNLYL